MTRRGKIARLPRIIRDELNRRLDNGERGACLLEWLNDLPEVKEILKREFDGRPINKVNLADWKSGGFVEWQNRQEARALIDDLLADGDEFAKVPVSELLERFTNILLAHYAVAFRDSNRDEAEEPRARFRRMRKSLRDMVRLRQSETARERAEVERERTAFQAEIAQQRLELDRERLELARQKLELAQHKEPLESPRYPKVLEKPVPGEPPSPTPDAHRGHEPRGVFASAPASWSAVPTCRGRFGIELLSCEVDGKIHKQSVDSAITPEQSEKLTREMPTGQQAQVIENVPFRNEEPLSEESESSLVKVG